MRVTAVAQAETPLLWLSLCCGVLYPVPCLQGACFSQCSPLAGSVPSLRTLSNQKALGEGR